MSAIQELAPYISAYQGNIKRAKEDQHYTIDRLVEESGVSRSAVTKLCAGTQQDPKLYNSAALCLVLGLSLDELFGLVQPAESPEELTEQISSCRDRKRQAGSNNSRAERTDKVYTYNVLRPRPVLYAALLFSDCLPCDGCADSEHRSHSRWRFVRSCMDLHCPDRRFSAGFGNYFLCNPKRTWRETWSASSVKRIYQTVLCSAAGVGNSSKRHNERL
jgi:transcriptional regulator with XRE-family HTH domain